MMHFCKVCGKMFSNGRSLGGHMRSHLSSLSSFQEEKASRRSSCGHSKCHQENQESQSVSEASKKRKRKRRVRRVAAITCDSLSLSESEKEDGALSLMMLSRDYSAIKKAKRYKCVTCGKVLDSYQALGGHRTSHRKMEAYVPSLRPNSPLDDSSVYRRRRNDHECPICHRVFSSGQALGGHKRTHLVSEYVSIDLNFPATELI